MTNPQETSRKSSLKLGRLGSPIFLKKKLSETHSGKKEKSESKLRVSPWLQPKVFTTRNLCDPTLAPHGNSNLSTVTVLATSPNHTLARNLSKDSQYTLVQRALVSWGCSEQPLPGVPFLSLPFGVPASHGLLSPPLMGAY